MKALKGLKVIPRKSRINSECAPTAPVQSDALVSGILTVCGSSRVVSENSAHKFSPAPTSQQDVMSLILT